ncbi:MAG: hypothetical protein HGB03_00905 [Candidatus Yonathbacteria bacterium]|nr:hypothetical protein [Candidatus Yonathbacteria bacterium]NTW47822.1 hypothetical protein [Candidatus Yonathbacteria bacterium]
MKSLHYWNSVLALSLAGTVFAGYLAGTKLITGSCALSEPCPYVLGYPACWYGFGMFAMMFIISLRGRFISMKKTTMCRLGMRVISFIGILFAGTLVAKEIPMIFSPFGPSYAMGLPSCAYGLLFYIAIAVLSFVREDTARDVVDTALV